MWKRGECKAGWRTHQVDADRFRARVAICVCAVEDELKLHSNGMEMHLGSGLASIASLRRPYVRLWNRHRTSNLVYE